jgi:putative transposase
MSRDSLDSVQPDVKYASERSFYQVINSIEYLLNEREMKRHDPQEITTILRLADDMMRDGKSQKDVCQSLGISVMTFHRWRKVADSTDLRLEPIEGQDHAPDTRHHSQIDDLRLENQRLRRIVSDLLLEKVKVQEALDKVRK